MGGIRTASSPGGNPENVTCPGGVQPPGMGARTATPPLPNPLAHQMMNTNLVMNGAVNPQLAHQPKKRGRKKKSELILTPEE